VQVYDFGEQEREYYIAMEYLHGVTLGDVLRRASGPLPVDLSAYLASLTLQGLHYAHCLNDETGRPLNIVHRDVSPDNVLMTYSGQLKLLDFGIAKATSTLSTTRVGTLRGKIAYMPPERLLSGVVEPSSDVYAVGVLLYQMQTGRRPFEAPSEPPLIHAIINEPPVPVRSHNPETPAALAAIVERALSKKPEERFGSAHDMQRALEEFLFSEGIRPSAGLIERYLGAHPEGTNRGTPSLDLETDEGAGQAAPSLRDEVPGRFRTATLSTFPQGERLGFRRRFTVALAAVLAIGIAAGVALLSPGGQAEAAVERAAQPMAVEARHPPLSSARAPDDDPPPQQPVVATSDRQTKPRPRRAVSSPGQVMFLVSPWADVLHGGKRLGTTPLAPVTVPSGRQVFVLRNDELGISRPVPVAVVPGSKVVVRVNLLE
jgi:serine/threonine-protein kinase